MANEQYRNSNSSRDREILWSKTNPVISLRLKNEYVVDKDSWNIYDMCKIEWVFDNVDNCLRNNIVIPRLSLSLRNYVVQP